MKRFGIRIFIASAVLSAVLLVFALPASMQDNSTSQRWSPPKFIDYGWWQYPALDTQGNLHVVWYGSEAKFDELFYARRNADGTWTTPNDIFCPCVQGFTVRNAIAATDDGIVHIIYRAHETQLYSSAYFNEGEFANKWSASLPLGPNSYYVDMIADRDNILHLTYAEAVLNPNYKYFEDDPCLLCTDVIYRRSTDGGVTWSDPVNISNTPNGSERMTLTQGASGRLYLAWSEGFDGWHTAGDPEDVRIVYSDDAGLTWSKPIILEGGDRIDERPINLVVTELRDGRILAVWRYSQLIDWNFYYQISDDSGQTWSDQKPIPGLLARNFNSDKYDNPNLVIDATGIVHLFAVGQAKTGDSFGNAALYHVQFAQDTWFKAEQVFQSFDETPEWPKAVIGAQNDIHLIWFNRVFNANGIQLLDRGLKVYYSHLDGNLQERPTPELRPTVTPAATSTPFQAHFDPTSTPIPTLSYPDSAVYLATEDMYASQTLIGGALVAGLFCAAVFIFLRFFRR